MDNFFTINIKPDENVVINRKKERDERVKYKVKGQVKRGNTHSSLIPYQINKICKSDNFDLLGKLNDIQINQYESTRKQIQKHILKCFKEDNIIDDFPHDFEENFFNEYNLIKKNFIFNLRKDKLNEIITYASQEKYKRSKPNELNSRYYSDTSIFTENEADDDDNFFYKVVRGDTSCTEADNKKKKKINKKELKNERKNDNEGDTSRVDNCDIVKGKKISRNSYIDNSETSLNKNRKQDDLVENTISTAAKESSVNLELNDVMSEFREKIKNWLTKFPDINCENFFFHLYFLVELHKEKRSMCQNCGSFDCEKDIPLSLACKNTFCFLCCKRVLGNQCHSTKIQYLSFKSNITQTLNSFKRIQYPYKSISCLKCLSKDHFKCGKPPYEHAKYSYEARKMFNHKLSRTKFVYLKNPLDIWPTNVNNNISSIEKKNDDNNDVQNKATGKNIGNKKCDDRQITLSDSCSNDDVILCNPNKNEQDKKSNNAVVYTVEDDEKENNEKTANESEYLETRIKYSFNDNRNNHKEKRNRDNNNSENANNKKQKYAHTGDNTYGDSHDNNKHDVNSGNQAGGSNSNSSVYNRKQHSAYVKRNDNSNSHIDQNNNLDYENNFGNYNQFSNNNSQFTQNDNTLYNKNVCGRNNSSGNNNTYYDQGRNNYTNRFVNNQYHIGSKFQKRNHYRHNNQIDKNNDMATFNHYTSYMPGVNTGEHFSNRDFNSVQNSFLNSSNGHQQANRNYSANRYRINSNMNYVNASNNDFAYSSRNNNQRQNSVPGKGRGYSHGSNHGNNRSHNNSNKREDYTHKKGHKNRNTGKNSYNKHT
ncbi:conserved Plasmodium protein, unknown function [Plasmodium ovale]|uniref:Uncharacterized protein n=2 Tax=Plasmodium ovale TaxID=36330 RepID=A0A1A8W1I8_PLAOA|nr:conserved Plasmodium protein, unknown function [Plasmodium ovale curtisi]SBS97035.1 conserved Plasmodium protein, unknown function [Plasmodium ovale curtisi]SCP05759.1 conserved Plasmodium protein, unknown function [Plasmodium ovale]